MSLPEWAEKYFYLSAESSYVESQGVAFPYQPAMLAVMASDAVREVTCAKSARVGWTKMMLACICYNAQHRRRNQAIWNPTDSDSDEFCKVDLETALRDVLVMSDVWTPDLAKNRANTLRTKLFRGSTLHLRGGKAAKNYRRLSVDVAYIDELDGFDHDIEREGAPDKLVAKRVEGATWPKLIVGSTPKTALDSQIEPRLQAMDVIYEFAVPCPHCDELHALTWTANKGPHGLRWVNDDPATAAHQCPHCAAMMTQAEFLQVWVRGLWIGDDGSHLAKDGSHRVLADGTAARLPSRVGFRIWTAYSPMTDWSSIVRDYLDAAAKAARGDNSLLKSFTNLTLGQVWEEVVEKTEANDLVARAEAYPLRVVPLGALILTAGIDVQDNRFEIVVWGWGRGEESWVVDYTVLHVDPAIDESWVKLDSYLSTRFRHAGGQWIGIDAAAIDTGGHHTHQAYKFAAKRHARRVFACKGHNVAGKPIVASSNMVDINMDGRIEKRGVRLWMIGTDTAKDLLFSRLKVTQHGPGYPHLSKNLPQEFFEQLTSEARVPMRTARGVVNRWQKVRPSARNEVLDCTVGAMFAAYRLDIHRYTSAMWSRLEAVLCPPIADMFTPTDEALPPSAPDTRESEPAERAEGASVDAGTDAPPAAPAAAAAPRVPAPVLRRAVPKKVARRAIAW